MVSVDEIKRNGFKSFNLILIEVLILRQHPNIRVNQRLQQDCSKQQRENLYESTFCKI